jgi:signal transduction histidine kinase/ActR/RegA family two-component response regulator
VLLYPSTLGWKKLLNLAHRSTLGASNQNNRSERDNAQANLSKTRVYTAGIDALHRQTPVVLTVNTVNSALVSVILASYKGQAVWLIFLALSIALTGVRAILWQHYLGCAKTARSMTKFGILATMGSGLSGLLWGGGCALLLPDNLVEQTFVAFVIGGMCIAALVSFSYYLPAFIAYVFPASLPMAGRFFFDGWPVHGDMMIVFAVAVTLAAYNSSRGFATGVRLNFDLTERTKDLSAANERLEMEIAQRRLVEDQLRQAHKMEAIGQLTGGIAHDFNNLLTAVVGHLEMAEARISHDQRTTVLIKAALRATERGATLTRHLLAFARRQHLEPQAVDVSAVVGGVEKMLRQTIGPNIRVDIQAEADLPPAWVDPNQLELAILNLALNARDAMPFGGTLRIDVEKRCAGTRASRLDLAGGDYVSVSVSDTGTGMNPETLERAFEPFFTTKEAGRGSGLGLSIVHGFAAQSGGAVQIASSIGNGTTVELWLPRGKREAIKRAEQELDLGQAVILPGQARILVCDDDSDVLALVGTALRESGYIVWEAENPALALETLEREHPIDLLLADYAMPEMNGVAVIDRARVCQQGLRVLLMSGHVDILLAGGASGIPLLVKPFKVAELRRRVMEALHPGSPDLALVRSHSRLLAASI